MAKKTFLLVLFLCLYTTFYEHAICGPIIPERSLSVMTDNDLFVGLGSDKYYSHGTNISYTHSYQASERFFQQLPDVMFYNLQTIFSGQKQIQTDISHLIFTPEDFRTVSLIRNDRPYAAALFMTNTIITKEKDKNQKLSLRLGLVGPAALGEEIQNTVHKLKNIPPFQGWENQLNNEFIINITYDHTIKHTLFTHPLLSSDVFFHGGIDIGNMYTQAKMGTTLRFGTYLENDFGPQMTPPIIFGSAQFIPNQKLGKYIFLGIESRLVGRNIFLDGNSFTDSHSINKKNMVHDFYSGISISYGNARLSYTHIIRSPEFNGQKEWHQFGSLDLTLMF